MPPETVELIARVQFGLTAGFHYLYPPLSIGLGWLLVVMEALWLKTGDAVYERMAKFYTRIFAATFAMGVTTGIVLEFEFGTNWAAYSRFVGDVFGSPLAAEAMFAFFLESVFLGLLVFGWNRVGRKMHFFATLMVAFGATLSAVWIIVANSWMQTPAGFALVETNGALRAEITSFWAMVFNPSSLDRLAHTLMAALTLASFFVMGISAWYLLWGRHEGHAKRALRIALIAGLLATLGTAGTGHHSGQSIAREQPAKLAAFEGHFVTTGEGAPLWVFGLPDVEARTVRYGLPIPGALSLLAHNSLTAPVTALDTFPESDWPPVLPVFFSFHLMVALGGLFILLTLAGLFFWWRDTLVEQRWLLWLYVLAIPLPYIANEVGWIAAEIGRQPWLVYGLLRTPEGLSEGVSGAQVLGSAIMFTGIYALLFCLYVFIILRKVKQGPDPAVKEAAIEA